MAYVGKPEGFEAISRGISAILVKITLFLQRYFGYRLIRQLSEYFIGNEGLMVEIS